MRSHSAEIWKARKEIGEQNGYELKKIYKKYKARHDENPQEYFSGKPTNLNKSKSAYNRFHSFAKTSLTASAIIAIPFSIFSSAV